MRHHVYFVVIIILCNAAFIAFDCVDACQLLQHVMLNPQHQANSTTQALIAPCTHQTTANHTPSKDRLLLNLCIDLNCSAAHQLLQVGRLRLVNAKDRRHVVLLGFVGLLWEGDYIRYTLRHAPDMSKQQASSQYQATKEGQSNQSAVVNPPKKHHQTKSIRRIPWTRRPSRGQALRCGRPTCPPHQAPACTRRQGC